jgi:hypothetical protein
MGHFAGWLALSLSLSLHISLYVFSNFVILVLFSFSMIDFDESAWIDYLSLSTDINTYEIVRRAY